MATLWFAKDRFRSELKGDGLYAQSGRGTHASIDEALPNEGEKEFCCEDLGTPNGNPGAVGQEIKNVIIEIEEIDKPWSKFDGPDFIRSRSQIHPRQSAG